jgi:molybdenum cofactor biosynthesis enzyme MoaA
MAVDSDQLAPLHARPLTVLFDISNKCNLRCRMCYFSYDSVFLRRAQFMSPETFERIASSVIPLAHTLFLSAGCESLTSPHFIDILRIAARFRPPQIKLLTNGLLMGAHESRALVDCGVTQVHVSLEGATRATYERIRRGADFEMLVANLALLRDIKHERRSHLPLVQFNVTLMNSNVPGRAAGGRVRCGFGDSARLGPGVRADRLHRDQS